MTLRGVAKQLLEGGWHPLPLPPFEKYPPPAGTTGYDGVDLTDGDIDTLPWAGNIGIRMPDDVIGIDVDAYKGGSDTLDNLVEKLEQPLPMTYLSHSGRGDGSGIRFYRVPVQLAWIPGLPGIEIVQRAHRYAVVAPSLHPEGRPYAWCDQAEPDVIQIDPPRVEDLAELPWSWIGHLSRATPADLTSRPQTVDMLGRARFLDNHTDRDAPGYFTTKVVGHFTERWKDGYSRHDTMVHCLTWAMECVRAGIIDGRGAIDELGAVWQDAHDNPTRRLLTAVQPTEFEAMVRHAIGKVADRPQAEFDRMHDEVAGVRLGTPNQQPLVIADYQEPRLSAVVFTDWAAFADRDAVTQPWLVEEFWPWGRAMALWAEAKAGKSELALWCACKLALGEHPWTGTPVTPIDVMYLDYEMTADDLDDRLAAFGIDPARLGHLHYAQLPPLHPLDIEHGGREVEELTLEVGAQAVVIDTFGRAVQGDENEADTVRAFYRHTGSRLKRLGVGYLRTDHAGKDRTRGQRGTSAKRDDVDVIWAQRRANDAGKVELDCTGSSRLSWVTAILHLDRVELNGVVSYSAPLRMGWPAGTADRARDLDQLGVPLDVTRRAARDALAAAGITPGKNDLLAAALKYRRERGNLGPQTSGTKILASSDAAEGADGDQDDNPLQ